MPLTDLLVVSHTHWDREWYHPVEVFRARLVRLIDELLDAPPHRGGSFLLDGQAVLLDDYLAIRPERAAELSALLREGRLEAGPWYVLADELIPSGEALVRNLLTGRDTVRRLRGEPPPVLYCPDSFGHPAMLPAIAAGFGCEVVVLWRGYGGARWPSGDTARWRAPDGSSVLVHHLPPDGYEFGSSLPADPTDAARRAGAIVQTLGDCSSTGIGLLLNGADHHARQSELPRALQLLEANAAPVRVRQSSLRDAASTLLEAQASTTPADIDGELRDSYGYTWTLGGTLGTRAHQKRANARAERLLTRDVEPWLALAPECDGASRALLNSAWRTLLSAHPHDTLCGTSIDAVADAFDARVESAVTQGRTLRRNAIDQLIDHDVGRARESQDAWQPAVIVRNAVPRPRGGVVELTLRAKVADVAVGPGSATRQGAPVRPPAFRVDGVCIQILERVERTELTESPRAYPDADRIVEARAVGFIAEMPGYSVHTALHRGRNLSKVINPVVATSRSLDNGIARVEVDEHGDVTLIDQVRKRRIASLLTFERARDAGDSYTPAIREALPSPTFVRTRLIHRGPIRAALSLEFRLGGSRARNRGWCTLQLELDADASALRLRVHGENRESDQRLRLRIATGLADSSTLADAAFGPVMRGLPRIDAVDAQMEHVVPTAPLHRWVARFADEQGVAVVSDGLAEYESGGDGSLAITLVRSVGELSRHDLPERPGHAGWPSPTPGAQCLGPYAASIAVQCCDGDSRETRHAIECLADDVLLPLTGETLRSNLRESHSAGGLELVGEGLTFSAVMPARQEGWMVLRCVNVHDSPATGSWRIARPINEAARARLDETILHPIETDGHVIAFQAGSREIVTILVR